MSYITLTDLPELDLTTLSTSEYLLVADTDNSYKVSLNSLNNFLLEVSGSSYQVLKNKIIDDISNYVDANVIYYAAQPVQNIAKGTPVKLIESPNDIILVDVCSDPTDVAIGVAKTDIVSGELGQIMVIGILDSFNTSNYTEGDKIYVNNGLLSNVMPSSGTVQFIGYVLNSGTNGKILIASGFGNYDAKNIHFNNATSALTSTNVQDAIDELATYTKNKQYIVSDKLLIANNKITLTYPVEGNIGIAYVYDDNIDDVITEYSCTVGNDKVSINFDSNDLLNGKYATVTYLAEI